MKATGIIRRIDDLGRVVIPKEIRNNMKLREGDPLEIYTTNEGIMLTKYTEEIDKTAFANKWLADHRMEMGSLSAKFSIEGSSTKCEVVRRNRRYTGTAVCNYRDNFNPAIGMVVAFCRAVETPVPQELME